MDVILFGLSIACALSWGLLVNAIFRHTRRVNFLLGWFVFVFGGIVLTAEVCSLFSSLTKGGFLFVQVLLTASGWGLWRLCKSPPLDGSFDWSLRFPSFRSNWYLYILLGMCATAYLVNAAVILGVPQNNYDSMTYHLARVGYWMQNESLFPWETANHRQTSSPPNAEIGLLWSMLFLRSDVLTGFVQWFFAGAGSLAIYGVSTLLGARRKQAIMAGLLWLTLPQIVLQSTTTQNDLVAGSLLVIAVYFLYLGWQSSRREDLILSGAALGLALGTKVTAGMAVVGLGILCLILLVKSRQPFKFFYTLAICYVLGFLLFGSLGYIQNLAYYGTLLGPKEYSEAAMSLVQPGLRIKLQTLLVYIYQFLDFSGLPAGLAKKLVEFKAGLAAPIFDVLGLHINYQRASVSQILNYLPRLHEDFTWFGPITIFGIIPGVAAGTWQSVRQKKGLVAWGLLLIAVVFTGLLILQGWSPHKNRYIVLTMTFLAPFLIFILNERKPVYPIILIAVGSFVMWHTVLRNESKPLVGAGAIWGKDALAMRTINNPTIEPLVRAVEKSVPSGSRLSVKLGSNGWDYVFFGERLNHTLVQFRQETTYFFGQQVVISGVDEASAIIDGESSLKELVEKEVDYFIVGPQQEFFLMRPPGLEPIFEMENGSLYRVVAEEIGLPTSGPETALPGEDATGILRVGPELSLSVGVMDTWAGSWEIEQAQGDSFLWLGQGEPQGMGAKLWSEEEQMACVTFWLAPGPSREDTLRTASIVYFDENEQRVTTMGVFERAERLSFELLLRQGVNPLGIYIHEPATIPVLPNGDTRHLLARLEQITVTENTGACP